MTLACARRTELGIVFLGSLIPNHNHRSTLYVRIKRLICMQVQVQVLLSGFESRLCIGRVNIRVKTKKQSTERLRGKISMRVLEFQWRLA